MPLQVKSKMSKFSAIRVGFTASKKIGNAVVRNRMKRRFRELARAVIGANGLAGSDHVMIGRAGGVERDFATLRLDLVQLDQRLKQICRRFENVLGSVGLNGGGTADVGLDRGHVRRWWRRGQRHGLRRGCLVRVEHGHQP